MRMTSRLAALALASAVALGVLTAACGGGGDDDDADSTPGVSASRTAGTITAGGTSAAGSRTVVGEESPSGDETRASGSPSAPGNTPTGGSTGGPTGGNSTPQPGGTANPVEATFAAEAGADIAGGDPSQPKEPVGDPPTPPPGASIDDDEIADPNPPQAGLQIILDMDATEEGIQSSRDVQVGDVIKVAVVAANLPAGGIPAFNFNVDYDKTKIVAPSYTGGPSEDRNPDLNNNALGSGWSCLPAPEGDLDDPGGIAGDGDPATGQAFLSCFVLGSGGGGTTVLATIEFRVIAAGSSDLSINNVAITEGETFQQIAYCEGDPAGDGQAVPCVGASVRVQ